MGSRFRADLPWPEWSFEIGNGLPFVDRIMLCETFLHWSATHLFRLLGVIVPTLYLLFGIEAVHANVIDAVWYLAPFLAAQIAISVWLTEGRVLPLMSDLYQMPVLDRSFEGGGVRALRPKGQKFKSRPKAAIAASNSFNGRFSGSSVLCSCSPCSGLRTPFSSTNRGRLLNQVRSRSSGVGTISLS